MQPKESIRLIQVNRWRSVARIDEPYQKQVMQFGNQNSLGKTISGDQQLNLQAVQPRSRSSSNKLAHEALATQFDELNFSTHTLDSGHTIQEEKRKWPNENVNDKKKNIY